MADCVGTFLWAGHVAAQAPEGQRVPQPSPTVEEENQRNTWAGTQPKLPPSLLRLFQSEEDEATEKDRAAKYHTARSDDWPPSKRPLTLPQDSAASAYGQQVAAWISVGVAAVATLVAVFGTVFLIKTFRETRRAANEAQRAASAAQRANKIAAFAARETSKAAAEATALARTAYVVDQRPWLSIKPVIVGDMSIGPRNDSD